MSPEDDPTLGSFWKLQAARETSVTFAMPLDVCRALKLMFMYTVLVLLWKMLYHVTAKTYIQLCFHHTFRSAVRAA
jgi:hypothetical protein